MNFKFRHKLSFLIIIIFIQHGYSYQSEFKPPGYKKSQFSLFFKKSFDLRNAFSKFHYSLSRKNTETLVLPKICKDYHRTFFDSFNDFQDSIWQRGQPWGKFHPDLKHQYYGDSEIFVQNGILHLLNSYKPKTFYLNSNDSISIPYGTGLINSLKSHNFKYGYFAIRSKNPSGPATWPAFWLAGTYRWPPEIDIFEMYGRKKGTTINKQTMTLHFGSTSNKTKHQLMKKISLPNNTDSLFHIYSCLWEPNKISFYTDGVKVKTIKLNKWMQQYFQEPMYVIINNAVDHNYLQALKNWDKPQDFQVDWIQIYQK